MRKRIYFGALTLLFAGSFMLNLGCAASHDRRDPTSEMFPKVEGEALDGSPVEFPAAGLGAPLLLLLGYEQDAQFDIDRWLLGVDQAEIEVKTFEVPTIAGMIPRMIRGTIDGGMRRGIPEEDWGSVVTVYGDADSLTRFTGNENGLTGRVVLLDASGRVAYFHDRGYSVGALRRLQAAVQEIGETR